MFSPRFSIGRTFLSALFFILIIPSVACGMTVKEIFSTAPQPAITSPQGKTFVLYKESHALLISASNYLGVARQGWKALEETSNDMDNVASVLKMHGFHIIRISDPSGEELYAAIRNFVADYGQDPDNRLVVFFSGHGFTDKRNNVGYLVPIDAKKPNFDSRDFYRKALAIETLQIEARKIVSKHALFFFDSCFSGTIFATRGDDLIPDQKTFSVSDRWRFLSESSKHPVRQFIAAGGAGEVLPAHSRFVPLLIKALTDGSGAQRRDGYITGKELGQYLEMTVPGAPTPQTPHSGLINVPELALGDMIFQLPLHEAGQQTASEQLKDALRHLKIRAGQSTSVSVKIYDPDNLVTAISPANRWVASKTNGGGVEVYEPASQQRVASIKLQSKTPDVTGMEIRQVLFSPDNEYLFIRATAGGKNNEVLNFVHLVSTRSWQVVREMLIPGLGPKERPQIAAVRSKNTLVIQNGIETGAGTMFTLNIVEWSDSAASPVRVRPLIAERAYPFCQFGDRIVFGQTRGQRTARGGWDTEFTEINLRTLAMSEFKIENFNGEDDNVAGLCDDQLSKTVWERLSELQERLRMDNLGRVTLGPTTMKNSASAHSLPVPTILAVDKSASFALFSVPGLRTKESIAQDNEVSYSVALLDLNSTEIIWHQYVQLRRPFNGEISPLKSAIVSILAADKGPNVSVEFLAVPLMEFSK